MHSMFTILGVRISEDSDNWSSDKWLPTVQLFTNLISDFDQKHIDMIVTHKFEGGDKSILEVGLLLKRLEGKG